MLIPAAIDGVSVIRRFIGIGTLSGAFTPTEAGGVVVRHATVPGFLVVRNPDLAGVFDALGSAARMGGSLCIATSCAGIMSHVLVVPG